MSKKFQISNFNFQISSKKSKVLEIVNGKFEIGNSEEGFTLVEILVALSIVVVVGVVAGSIIISTLRGSTKATVLSDVKQSGDYAVIEMSREIRSATAVNMIPCVTPVMAQTITATQLDGSAQKFDCSGSTITEAQGTAQSMGPAVPLFDGTTTVVNSCSIVCRQESTEDVPTIQINFSLKQKSQGNFSDQTAIVPFQTTVSLRNIQQ